MIAILLVAGVAVIGYVLNKNRPQAIVVDNNTPLPPAQGYVMGSDSAPVEIVEFGDFECPTCAQFYALTEPDIRTRLVETGLARFRFMDFPLAMHPNSLTAHNAAACANEQGRFWEYHDKLFTEQPRWWSAATSNPGRMMKGYARDLGLDGGQFDQCLETRRHEPQIRANYEEGVRRGVTGTPNFFVGPYLWPGNIGFDQLRALVDSATRLARSDTTS